MASTAKSLALSATETELLRDLRSRLNRVRVGTPAEAVLSGAFFKACERVDLAAEAGAAAGAVSAADVAAADMVALRTALGRLQALRTEQPAAWRATLEAGVPQAILSRRLALAGREQPVEAG